MQCDEHSRASVWQIGMKVDSMHMDQVNRKLQARALDRCRMIVVRRVPGDIIEGD